MDSTVILPWRSVTGIPVRPTGCEIVIVIATRRRRAGRSRDAVVGAAGWSTELIK